LVPEKAIEELIERSATRTTESAEMSGISRCSFCMSHIRNPKFTLKWANFTYHSQCANFYANFISANPPMQ